MTAKSSVVKKKSTTKTALKKVEKTAFSEYNPYVNELRSAFWKTLVFFALGATLGMVYYQKILTFVLSLFKLEEINLVLTSPYQFIDLAINTGFFVGIVFCLPVFLHYVLQFTKPALKDTEYKLLVQMLPISLGLFIFGFSFGVWVLQYVVDLFSQTSSGFDVGNIWDLSNFMGQVIVMGLSLAFVFQMPTVMTVILRLKIVTFQDVAKQRKVIYAALLLFASILPPTDLIALALLTLIPLFLFEITLLLNKRGNY